MYHYYSEQVYFSQVLCLLICHFESYLGAGIEELERGFDEDDVVVQLSRLAARMKHHCRKLRIMEEMC